MKQKISLNDVDVETKHILMFVTNQRGITLVVLVITVIVLLILAGVAISAIVGEDGIFSKAKYSAEKYNNAAKNEALAVNEIISNSDNVFEPEPNGQFSAVKGVNTPDTSKLPTATTKYVTWTGTDTFTEALSNKKIANWYDYSNSKWANIKTTSTDGSLEAYWVWIPRFAYKLPESSTAKTIEVAFAKGNGTTVINPGTGVEEQAYYATDTAITTDGSGLYVKKTVDAPSKWIIHPAFSFGNSTKLNENTQLAGIWIAKYEASSSNPSATNGGDNNPALKVQVKPNVTSWRNMQTKNRFSVCRVIQDDGGALGTTMGNATVNTHLIKNMEWGAVAILSQSKFGSYDKTTNTNKQVWNNPNSSYKTGTSGVTSPDQVGTPDASCAAYNTVNGTKASTTGNVYGIYDMAGSAWDMVAAVYTGTQTTVLGIDEAKYYDSYTNPGNTITNYEGGKIGDMTKELFPVNLVSWNNDYSNFVYSLCPVLYRGGDSYDDASIAGVFAFGSDVVSVSSVYTFRPALIVL